MFKLEITTENAAFTEDDDETPGINKGEEVARILRFLASDIHENAYMGPRTGRVYDINGNTVGKWELT